MSKIYLKVVYKQKNLNRQQLYVCLYTIQLEVSSSEKIQAPCFFHALFIVNQQTSALSKCRFPSGHNGPELRYSLFPIFDEIQDDWALGSDLFFKAYIPR